MIPAFPGGFGWSLCRICSALPPGLEAFWVVRLPGAGYGTNSWNKAGLCRSIGPDLPRLGVGPGGGDWQVSLFCLHQTLRSPFPVFSGPRTSALSLPRVWAKAVEPQGPRDIPA
jgi:hypothetical protein